MDDGKEIYHEGHKGHKEESCGLGLRESAARSAEPTKARCLFFVFFVIFVVIS